MSAADFRRYGHATIDWIADYWSDLESKPVLSQAVPGQIASLIPDAAPTVGEPFDAVLADLDRVVVPGITHWQHPNFYAYFPANSSPAAVLADLISSGIGAQGMIWSTSPAVTEIEQVVLDWLARALDLPEAFLNSGSTGGGVIQDTASTSTMTAMLAALHRATDGAARERGVQDGRKYAVYASSQAHSSMMKAAMMTGIGRLQVREIDVDPATQAMDTSLLQQAIERDIDQGVIPVMVLSAVGTTSTCAIDPTAKIGEVCRAHNIWLHVDAAFAGVANVCEEFRYLNDGVAEYADSYVTNPHKWLLTTFDCSTFWVRDRAALIGALSILPEYLRNAASESGQVVDYRDWHPQLGRRFRSLKLWTVMRTYGINGMQAHIRASVQMARLFEEKLLADGRFSLVVPRELSVVVFALRTDDLTTRLMNEINSGGTAYLTHTKVDGRVALRLAVGGVHTKPRHIEQTWTQISSVTDRLDV